MFNRSALALALSLWLLVLGAEPAAGQTIPYPGPRTCATQPADDWQQAQLQRHLPGYRTAKLATPARLPQRTTAITYTLPVVVHIIHNGEAVGTGSNISQAQVQSQLDVLNEDYRNRNANGPWCRPPFSRCAPMRSFSLCWPRATPTATRCPSRVSTASTARPGASTRRPTSRATSTA
ncbi:hypothetical protein [Hymenobacter sp. BRD67]|uniref:hypothetical protein n=1 Tax=Hymenobacter sp. BRD67 TaxID=2675877 RepID=UPI0020B7EFB0|nr:hypothetical protein [Hymenobacter sp. BRD67]